jgi:hypothetical protein
VSIWSTTSPSDGEAPDAAGWITEDGTKGAYLIVLCREQWRWSSLAERMSPPLLPWLHPGPGVLPASRAEHVHEPQTEAELARLREAVRRGSPFGAEGWVREAAGRWGLESTLRPRGRPRKARPTAAPPGEAGLF